MTLLALGANRISVAIANRASRALRQGLTTRSTLTPWVTRPNRCNRSQKVRAGEVPNYTRHLWQLAGADLDNFHHQISISDSQTLRLSACRKYFAFLNVVGVAAADLP